MDENTEQPYNLSSSTSSRKQSRWVAETCESLKEAAIIKAGSGKGAVDEKRMKEIVEEGVVKSLSIFTECLEGLAAAIENGTQQTLQLKETIEKGTQQTLQLKETIEKGMSNH
ncbi:hypothetical protein HK096_005291 [Nowakowskiella sp. JEL0078]|nr:hypothetical protein HK096_005291 [Nowakowskiella sp. JEL0078]